MVQVRIARALSGTTQIDVTAENPTTLLALQRDQPQLHRTLDEAGIPAAGRTVTFHVVPATQSAANSNGPGASASHGDSQAGAASRSNTGRTDADGSSGGRDGYLTRERNNYSTTRRPGTAPAPAGTAERVNRIGLDITA
jgi:flagellar hook-length control protein FliK